MNTAPISSGSACRCPRCAYALTGLPGAPAQPYGAFTADERCPECALLVPAGAHCLVGGATPDVVDPSGSRGALATVAGAAILIGGPWACIMIGVVLMQALKGATLNRGVPLSTLQSWAIGALPLALGIGVLAWFIWSRWRRVDGAAGDGERAGARRRRAMVVRGGLHLWSGEPSADAKPRSLAGGDIRDVRGRRHIPLFRKKGAGEAGAIDFVTPLTLWSSNDAKQAWNMNDGRFAGTVWIALPEGVRAETIARDLERTLRSAPAEAPVAVATTAIGAVETPTVDGDPNHLAVPLAITAGTPAEQPTCPRCSHGLGAVPEGAWWEPLPSAVTCPECGLAVPAGAVVVSGFRHAGEAQMRGGRGMLVIVLGVLSAVALFVAAFVVLANRVSPVIAFVLQAVAVAALPIFIVRGIRMSMRPIARPRARFQRSTETWIAEPGRLRIVVRGAPTTPEITVPATGIGRIAFGEQFVSDNSMPVQTDNLSIRGTAPQLGMVGERHLHVPLPAEVDEDTVVAAVRAAMK
jgi:hypothetical protein